MSAELEPDPIVVYGAPRSGTTYLEQILNAHPDVFISHETRVFAWLHHALGLTHDDRLVANQREGFVEYLRGVFPQMIRDFYRGLAPDVRYWGDKNPHYADPFNDGCLETVADLFPGSRFIHIIRDGRDVVSSLTRKRDAEQAVGDVRAGPFHVVQACRARARPSAARCPRDRYFELRYEDLVTNDAALSGEIFDFLGHRTPSGRGGVLREPAGAADAVQGADAGLGEGRHGFRLGHASSVPRNRPGACS